MELLRTLEEKVSPTHAAVLTVDVQNDFFHEDGYVGKTGSPRDRYLEMAPRLEKFLQAARRRGLTIIHVISHHDEQYASPVVTEQKMRKGHPMESDGRRLRDAPYCRKGTWGCGFYLIEPAPGEEIVIKHRYSAFQGTNLNLLLRSNGVKTVILTGASTNVCVESTARDAYMHDYYQMFVSDCTETATREEHEHTLKTIDKIFGQVVTSEEIVKAWGLPMEHLGDSASGFTPPSVSA